MTAQGVDLVDENPTAGTGWRPIEVSVAVVDVVLVTIPRQLLLKSLPSARVRCSRKADLQPVQERQRKAPLNDLQSFPLPFGMCCCHRDVRRGRQSVFCHIFA